MPALWPKVPIEQLCSHIVDCLNRTATAVDEPSEFIMIRTTNVKRGWIDLSDVKFVNEPTFHKWTRRERPVKGDVILTREAPLGEVGMIRGHESVFLGQRLVMYRADPTKLDARFLLYVLQGEELQAQIRAFGSGSTVEHMRVPDAKKLLIPTPAVRVQRSIGEHLGAYDDLIENNTRRIEIMEEMARRIFEEWFVRFRAPGVDPSGFVDSPLGRIPEGWEVRRLGDILDLKYGKALKADDRQPGPVAVFGSSGNIGTHNEALVRGPGIIVGRKGNVGSVHWTDVDFFPIDTVFFVSTDKPLAYIFHLLRLQTFLNSDAAVPGLNRAQALGLRFVLPGPQPLKDFADTVAPNIALVRNLVEQNRNLRAQRNLLLPKLISGEIDVSVSADAVQEAAE